MEPARNCLCFNLRKSARALTQLYDGALRPIGLRITQFSLLVGSCYFGSITLKQLADTMGMDRTTLTRNLMPLQRKGLVHVQPGPDRREREVRLTPKGQAILAKALPLWKKTQRRMVNDLGHDNVARLLGDLWTTFEISQMG